MATTQEGRLARVAAHILRRRPPAATCCAGVGSAQQHGAPQPLSEADLQLFLDSGYLVLPSVLSVNHSSTLRGAVDELERDRNDGKEKRVVAYAPLGELAGYPPIVDVVKQLMGHYGNERADCAMHHMHCSRHTEGAAGVKWHHDYNCMPSVHDRAQLSIHVFFYFAGLDGSIGDLLLLPRSQHTISAVRGMGEVFGTSDLPGSVTVDRLQEGSAIVLHSGLLHARRPKPGGGVRYFVDVEYVQPGPHRWPAYLDEAQHQDICEIGRALPGNKSPQYAHLWRYDDAVYCDSTDFYTFFRSLPGV